MARESYILANWKMNTTLSEAMVLVSGVLRKTEDLEKVNIVFFPPYIWLVPIKEQYRHAALGAQNVWWHPSGPYTGEIAVNMLKGIAKYVIVGHSERRSIFGEDDATVNAKLHAVLDAHLVPVLAIGEEAPLKIEHLSDAEIERHVASSRLGKALDGSTRGLTNNEWGKLIIAYEPVWAIGTGRNATGSYSANVIRALRRIIAKKTNKDIATEIPILYGGSVTRHSAAEFADQSTIDGVLVGGASLKVADFSAIAEAFAEAQKRRDKKNEIS